VTRLPLDQVFFDVERVVKAGAKVVKFVDRTFNLTDDRTLGMWRHLLRYAGLPVTFHFEVAPDRISEAQLELLAQAPSGLFQVEAGIQSVHPATLGLIDRRMDVGLALERIAAIREKGNVHVHADLIVGLPAEGAGEVAVSFDRLSQANPHHLQVGFLKLIRGTRIRRETEKWGYRSRVYPPYEVLASDALSAEDALGLKDFEETVERFRNSGRFLLLLQWWLSRADSAFAFFRMLTDRQREQGLLRRAVSAETLFLFLREMITTTLEGSDGLPVALHLLGLDWVCANRNPFLPQWFPLEENEEAVKTNEVRLAYGEQGDDMPQAQKAIRNRIHVMTLLLPEVVRQGVRPAWEMAVPLDWKRPVRVLVDVRRIHPVLGRPEVVVLRNAEV
jgi:hypothetical protein